MQLADYLASDLDGQHAMNVNTPKQGPVSHNWLHIEYISRKGIINRLCQNQKSTITVNQSLQLLLYICEQPPRPSNLNFLAGNKGHLHLNTPSQGINSLEM